MPFVEEDKPEPIEDSEISLPPFEFETANPDSTFSSTRSTQAFIMRPRTQRVTTSTDSGDDSTTYFASESPAEVFSTTDSISEEGIDNLQNVNVIDADETTDEENTGHYGDFNSINMELDPGDYTSEDEEEEVDDDVDNRVFFRPLHSQLRHHHRSSSQRSRGFTPLHSRLASIRRQTNNFSTLTPSIKFMNELDAKTGSDGLNEHEHFSLPYSSFLHAGISFTGTQNLTNSQPSQKEEWEVKVTIHHVDYKTGAAVGLMEALNVPSSSNTVVTYWEGEIIDLINHSLWTNKWQATPDIDLQHWRKFEAFREIDLRSISHGALSKRWFKQICEKYIFMRWKERCFVNITAYDSGLTIAGFYYICIRRSDGAIEGYYFDPVSTPYQKLTLKPSLEGNGFSFAEFSFN